MGSTQGRFLSCKPSPLWHLLRTRHQCCTFSPSSQFLPRMTCCTRPTLPIQTTLHLLSLLSIPSP